MNTLTISVCFEEEPTHEEKGNLQSQLITFIRALAPDAEISVKSGKGSWWIQFVAIAMVPGTWLLLEIGSWAISKALDKLTDSVNTKRMDNTVGEDEIDSPEGQRFDIIIPKIQQERSSVPPSDPSDEIQSHAMSAFMEMFTNSGPASFSLSEWSDKHQRGSLMRVKHDGKGNLSVSAHKTDSYADFQSGYDKFHEQTE